MNEQEVLDILARTGAVIKDSHIVYTSGKHGTAYVNKDAVYPHTKETSRLCKAIAEHFTGRGIEVVISPAVGGVILSQWVAEHLDNLVTTHDVEEVLGVYAEREEQSVLKADSDTTFTIGGSEVSLQAGDEVVVKKPQFVIKRGYDKVITGKRVLVVEDVLTTGGSAREVIEAVRALDGEVVGLGVLCNRGGITAEDVGGVPELFALVNVKLDAWDEAECPLCAKGVPINTDVGKGREFLARKAAG